LVAHRVGQRQISVAFEHRDQLGQKGHKALGTNPIGGHPGDDKRVLHGGAIESLARTSEREGRDDRMREQPDGVLADIASHGDELIEDDRLLLRRRGLIPRCDARKQLAFSQKTH